MTAEQLMWTAFVVAPLALITVVALVLGYSVHVKVWKRKGGRNRGTKNQ